MTTDNITERTLSDEANEKRTYTVAELATILQIGRSKAYDLCSQNLFRIIKIGRAVRISKASFDEWFENQTK